MNVDDPLDQLGRVCLGGRHGGQRQAVEAGDQAADPLLDFASRDAVHSGLLVRGAEQAGQPRHPALVPQRVLLAQHGIGARGEQEMCPDGRAEHAVAIQRQALQEHGTQPGAGVRLR